MIDSVCLEVKDGGRLNYICNRAYIDKCKEENTLESGKGYEVLENKLINNMEDLIIYCQVYRYDVDIPDNYSVLKLYNIVFTTGDFDPVNRACSNTHSSIVYSSDNEEQVRDKFRSMCGYIDLKPVMSSKNYYCWQSEEYAYNQIVHSYNITESYYVTKV